MPVSPRERIGRRIMRVMFFTAVFSTLSMLTFNIVLPELRDEFHIDLAQASWLSSGYLFVYALGNVVYGKLASRFRLKNLITCGLTLFAVGSLLGFASTSFWLALTGRLVQAAGASVVPAAAMLLPIRYFPPERRPGAMSMTTAGLALGTALGPVVAALLLTFLNWRWLYVPPVFVLVLVPFFRKYVNDDSTPNPGKLDWLGGALLALTVAFMLIGATYLIGWMGVAAALMMLLFIWRLSTAADPFIQPALFRNGKYTSGLMLAALISSIASGMALLPPVLLADVYGLGSEWIGFLLVPAAAVSSVLSRVGGKVGDRKGERRLYLLASSLLMLGLMLLALFSGVVDVWLIPLFLIFVHVGQTFIQVAVSSTLSKTLPKEQAGVGMGLFQMLNGLASSMAVIIYGLLLELDFPSWNPFVDDTDGAMITNLFLVFLILHAVLLMFYRSRFQPEGLAKSQLSVKGGE